MSETREHDTTAIANVEMASIWDGEEGDDWTDNAERYDATDRWISARFEAEVEIGPSERVLDVGCGTGKSTRSAARRASAGSVLGIDLSSRMLDEARRRSAIEGLTNIRYVRGDAQVHPFEAGGPFDLAISTFGAMFFADPVAAFTNIGRGLRPGGRIAFLAWQPFERNEWLTAIFGALSAGRALPAPAAGEPGPFGLADAHQVREIVRRAGLAAPSLTPIHEPFWVGADAGDAWALLSRTGIVRGLIEDLHGDAQERALHDLREVIAAHADDGGVLFSSAAWLISTTRP